MDILNNKKDCCGCHACYNVCPTHAINMCSDEEGFLYPIISQDLCIHCNQCKSVCPVFRKIVHYEKELGYACYASDFDERMTSSSGGVFAIFARAILSSGGIVCGAAYNKDMEVEHILINNEEDLYRIKGTKYVQSRIGSVYQEIKRNLDEEKQVLFSGTPCQVAGLKSFLRKEYDKLICIDLICHGVPSPGVFKRYLEEVAPGDKVIGMTFRNKKRGMSHVLVEFETGSGNTISERYSLCAYTIGFIQNLYTRPSCFNCHFKGQERFSDITIGDFWGIQEFHPGFADDFGTSAVIIRGKKGADLLQQVIKQLRIVDATVSEIASWNNCLNNSVVWNEKRTEFYSIWKEISIKDAVALLKKEDRIIDKAKKAGLFERLKGKVKRWLA